MPGKDRPRKSDEKSSDKKPTAKKSARKKSINSKSKKAKKTTQIPNEIIPFPAKNYQNKVMEMIGQLPERYGKQIMECIRKYGPAMAEPMVGHLAHKARNPIIKALLTGLQRAIKMM